MTPPPLTLRCACGCDQPHTNRGGYNSRLNLTLWFASNTCQARFETALLAIKAGPAAQRGTRPSLRHVQDQIKRMTA